MSRERVDEDFRAWDMRQMEYEFKCPICSICGQRITDSDNFYLIDDLPICDDINCIKGYLRPYKKSVDLWIRNKEG